MVSITTSTIQACMALFARQLRPGRVIELDEGLADFQIGFKETGIDWKGFIAACDDRIEQLENGKLFVVKFIGFQYGEQLSENCKAHNPVFKSLHKNSLSIPFPKGMERDPRKRPVIVKVKVKVIVKVKVKQKPRSKPQA